MILDEIADDDNINEDDEAMTDLQAEEMAPILICGIGDFALELLALFSGCTEAVIKRLTLLARIDRREEVDPSYPTADSRPCSSFLKSMRFGIADSLRSKHCWLADYAGACLRDLIDRKRRKRRPYPSAGNHQLNVVPRPEKYELGITVPPITKRKGCSHVLLE